MFALGVPLKSTGVMKSAAARTRAAPLHLLFLLSSPARTAAVEFLKPSAALLR